MACTPKILFFALLIGYSWSASLKTADDVDLIKAGQASSMLLTTPWGAYLTPAPVAACLLGQLNMLSVRQGVPDFALQQPTAGFQHIKHPDSFRASLAQLGNDGTSAFTLARDNMLKITSNMAGLPDLYKRVIKNAKTAKLTTLRKLVTTGMDRVVSSAEECIGFAEAVSTEFLKVRDLMNELLEGSAATGGHVEKQMREAEIQMQISRNTEKMLKEQINLVEKKRNDTDANLKTLREAYNSAFNSIPSGWEILGQEIVKSLSNTLIQLGTTAANYAMISSGGFGAGAIVVGGVAGGIKDIVEGDGSTTQASGGKPNAAGATDEKAFGASLDDDQLIAAYQGVLDQLDALHGIAQRLFKPSTTAITESPNTLIARVKTTLPTYAEIITRLAKPVEKTTVLALVKEGQDIADEMDTLTKTLTAMDSLQTGHEDKITKLSTILGKMRQLVLASKSNRNAATAPNVQVKDPVEYEGAGGIEKYKAAMAQQRVETVEAESVQLLNKQLELTAQMMNATNQLIDLSAKQIDFRQIAQLIVEAIKIISQVQKAWMDLVLFFQSITNNVRAFNNLYVKPVMQDLNDIIGPSGKLDEGDREMIVDQLESNQRDFVRESTALTIITDTYRIVAEQYVSRAMSGVGRLLSVTDPKQQVIEQNKLQNQAQQDGKAIETLVSSAINNARKTLRAEQAALAAITDDSADE